MSKEKKEKQVNDRRYQLSEIMPSDDYSHSVLTSRAQLLSKVEEDSSKRELITRNYIKFMFNNNECYGIPYAELEDVKTVENITAIPMAPPFVIGIYYWHGKIVPVIDLAKYFGIETRSGSDDSCYVATVTKDKLIIGFAFHDVVGVDSYVDGELDKSLVTSQQIKNDYIEGIHAGRVTILNVKSLLSDIAQTLMNKKGDKS